MLTDVEQELIVAVSLELLTDLVGNLLTELLLALHSTLTEGLVEQCLVHLSLHETADLGNLESEVTLVVFHLFLLNLQQARYLDIALRIGLAGIPSDDVTQLTAVKQLLLVVHLHILRHQHGVGNLNATVHLAQVTLQHVTLLGIKLLNLLILTGTALIHLHLLVDELVVNGDVIERNLVLTAQLSLKLRGYGNVELKCQGLVALEVEGFLLLAGEGLTQHLNLVLTNIFVQLLA